MLCHPNYWIPFNSRQFNNSAGYIPLFALYGRVYTLKVLGLTAEAKDY